jgi:hypothetical protein
MLGHAMGSVHGPHARTLGAHSGAPAEQPSSTPAPVAVSSHTSQLAPPPSATHTGRASTQPRSTPVDVVSVHGSHVRVSPLQMLESHSPSSSHGCMPARRHADEHVSEAAPLSQTSVPVT